MDFRYLIKAQLSKIGKPFSVHTANGIINGVGVIEQTWRKNKSLYEEKSSRIGRYYKDYYNYIGPYDIDITALDGDCYVTVLGDKFYFVKKENVYSGGHTQYYRGILKKAEEGDIDVFNVGN